MDNKVFKSVKEIVTNLEKRFEETANDGQKDLSGNTTQDDVESSDNKSRQAGKEAADRASSTANDKIKDDLKSRGVPEPPHVKDISDKASQVRDALPKFSLAAKAAGLAITAMVVGVVGLFVGIRGNKEGQQFGNIINQNNLETARAEFNLKLTVSTEEFVGMVNGLNIPNIPPTVLVLPTAPVAAAYVPPPMAMPAAVAAIEQAPMEVEVDNDGKTYTGMTTVGQVYRTIPQARRQIETHVSTIQHDYIDKSLLNPNRVPDQPYDSGMNNSFTATSMSMRALRVLISICKGNLCLKI